MQRNFLHAVQSFVIFPSHQIVFPSASLLLHSCSKYTTDIQPLQRLGRPRVHRHPEKAMHKDRPPSLHGWQSGSYSRRRSLILTRRSVLLRPKRSTFWRQCSKHRAGNFKWRNTKLLTWINRSLPWSKQLGDRNRWLHVERPDCCFAKRDSSDHGWSCC